MTGRDNNVQPDSIKWLAAYWVGQEGTEGFSLDLYCLIPPSSVAATVRHMRIQKRKKETRRWRKIVILLPQTRSPWTIFFFDTPKIYPAHRQVGDWGRNWCNMTVMLFANWFRSFSIIMSITTLYTRAYMVKTVYRFPFFLLPVIQGRIAHIEHRSVWEMW
jgi:hypothetical protein